MGAMKAISFSKRNRTHRSGNCWKFLFLPQHTWNLLNIHIFRVHSLTKKSLRSLLSLVCVLTKTKWILDAPPTNNWLSSNISRSFMSMSMSIVFAWSAKKELALLFGQSSMVYVSGHFTFCLPLKLVSICIVSNEL